MTVDPDLTTTTTDDEAPTESSIDRREDVLIDTIFTPVGRAKLRRPGEILQDEH